MPCTEHCSIDVVMEGGGIKGIALVGVLAVLEDRGYRWVNMAGTSAGAIVATLATAGYTAHELRPIIGDLDFTWFMDSSPRWLPPRLRATYNILAHWGIYKGDRFLTWMREMLAAKGVRTFADLKRGLISRGQQYRVRVVASDVTRGKMIVLPEDSAAYGIDPDDLEVALAVRMSMSIPGFFRQPGTSTNGSEHAHGGPAWGGGTCSGRPWRAGNDGRQGQCRAGRLSAGGCLRADLLASPQIYPASQEAASQVRGRTLGLPGWQAGTV
jgi:hypothetical protein